MSAHVLLNLLSELKKRNKMNGSGKHFITFYANSSINTIIED